MLRLKAFACWLRGLPENAVLRSRLQVEARRPFLQRVASGYGVYLTMLVLPLVLVAAADRTAGEGWGYQAFQITVVVLAFVQVIYVAFRVAAITSQGVVDERHKGTLLPLALTRMNSADYADGLVLSAFWPVARELTLLLPLAGMLGVVAGGDAFSVAMLWVTSLFMGVLFAYLGVLISATSRTAAQASTRAATQTAFLLVGSLFLVLMGGFVAFPLFLVHPFASLGLAFWGYSNPWCCDPWPGWLFLRWWSLFSLVAYLGIIRDLRRRAVAALERVALS